MIPEDDDTLEDRVTAAAMLLTVVWAVAGLLIFALSESGPTAPKLAWCGYNVVGLVLAFLLRKGIDESVELYPPYGKPWFDSLVLTVCVVGGWPAFLGIAIYTFIQCWREDRRDDPPEDE